MSQIEEKWPRSVFASLVMIFIIILFAATLIPHKMIDAVIVKEREWGYLLFGKKDTEQIVERTDSVYTSLVIGSGLKDLVGELFIPEIKEDDPLGKATRWWFEYLMQRGEALQKITYQVLYRIVLMAFWVPLFLTVLIPAFYAGWMRWRAKRHGFDYSSPFLNNNAATILTWGIALVALSVLLPLPLPPLLVATFLIIMIPVLVAVLISNLPKRI